MAAVARMKHAGVPIDVPALTDLRTHWKSIKSALGATVDTHYGVYEGGVFKRARWEAWLDRAGIPWPRLPSGQLALDDDTFKDMARAYPSVGPIRD